MNIACGQFVIVSAIIDMINEIVGKLVNSIYPDPHSGDIKHSSADITKAEGIIGFHPIVSFEEGLKKANEWYRDNLLD